MRKTLAASALVWAAAMTLASCGGSSDDGAADIAFDSSVGCDERMDTAFQQWADRGVAFSVVDLGTERQCVAGYGFADPDTGRLNTPDTVFSIGSITKPFTAAAIYNLIDEGVLKLDDVAADHIPDLEGPAAKVTIRQLLLHTSGIDGEHGFDHVAMTKQEAVSEISELWSIHNPGRDYHYNNTNYTILALIIEEVTEQGYRQYVVDKILFDADGNPLDAGWWDGEPSATGPRAWGYEQGRPAKQRGDAEGPHWAMNGNGAMAMSPLEMAKWTQAFFDGKILSAEATDMFYSTWTEIPGYRELAGWAHDHKGDQIGKPMLTTAGGGSGIGHEMDVTWLPDDRQVVVIARNVTDIDVPQVVAPLWPSLMSGTGIPGPPSLVAIDPSVLEEVLGRYRVGESGVISIEENSGGIVARIEGNEAIVKFFQPEAERQGGVSSAEAKVLEAFSNPLDGQNARNMERYEKRYGPLQDVEVAGVIQPGRFLEVLLRFNFESESRPGGGNVGLKDDLQFWVADEPVDSWTMFFHANEEDGNEFVLRYEVEFGPRVKLRLEPDGLVIDSSTAGITSLTRIE